jgi:hypothetical protein
MKELTMPVGRMLQQIHNAPEVTCEASHRWQYPSGKVLPSPTPCSGVVTYRFIHADTGIDMLVCDPFIKDFTEASPALQKGARYFKI